MTHLTVKYSNVYLDRPIILEAGLIDIDISLPKGNSTSKETHPMINVKIQNGARETWVPPITKMIRPSIDKELKQLVRVELNQHLQGKDESSPDEFRRIISEVKRQIFNPYKWAIKMSHLEGKMNDLLRQEILDLALEDLRDIIAHPDSPEAFKYYKTKNGCYHYRTRIYYDKPTESLYLSHHQHNQERVTYYDVGNISILFESPNLPKE